MISMSENLTEIATALSLAQAEMEDAELDGWNPHFKTKFATLKAIRKASRAVMARHGLAIVQAPGTEEGRPCLETLITHKSGQWISSSLPLLIDKETMQGLGSAISYARRYTQGPMLGIVNEEDDDGTAASQKRPSQRVPMAIPKDPLLDYIIPFGKEMKGKRLHQVPLNKLHEAVSWLENEAQSGNTLTEVYQDFIVKVKALQTMSGDKP